MTLKTLNLPGDYNLVDTDAYSTAIADIGEGATYSTDTYIQEIDVTDIDFAHIQMKSTGANASSAGVVTYHWLGIGKDGQTYPTVAEFTTTLTLSTNTAVRRGVWADVRPYRGLKILQVVNGDATYHITSTNATVSGHRHPV